MAGLRRELFSRLLEMPPGFFAERRTGELTSRLTVDIGLLQGVLSHQISEFCPPGAGAGRGHRAAHLAAAAAHADRAAAWRRWWSGTAHRLRAAAPAHHHRRAGPGGRGDARWRRRHSRQIRTVQSFVQERAERARYGERVSASVRLALQRAQVRGAFFGMLTFSTFAAIVFVLWQGGLLVLDGRLSAGALVGSCCIPSRSRPRSARWPRPSPRTRRRWAQPSGCSRSSR